jgi:transporter family-2 protein
VALAAFLAFLAGAVTAVQAATNGLLGRRIGVLETVAFSALVTTTVVHLIVLARNHSLAGPYAALRQPAWLWIGGLLGATALTGITFAPSRIGVFATIALLIGGQVAGSILIDSFGWLGVARTEITPVRVAALLLVLGGALLALRR